MARGSGGGGGGGAPPLCAAGRSAALVDGSSMQQAAFSFPISRRSRSEPRFPRHSTPALVAWTGRLLCRLVLTNRAPIPQNVAALLLLAGSLSHFLISAVLHLISAVLHLLHTFDAASRALALALAL